MVYSGVWGKVIHEKNHKSKISWHCPFKELFNNAVKHFYICTEYYSMNLMFNEPTVHNTISNHFKYV